MVTISQISSLYTEFNEKYFHNELPSCEEMHFEMKNIKPIGQASDRRPSGRGLRIRVSTRYTLTENQLRNVLCHEMVHIWQYVTGHSDHHGPYFRAKAALINKIDSSMVIERCFNSEIEGKLERSNKEEKSVLITWCSENLWHVGRISENYTDAYGWLMTKYKKYGITMYNAVGGELLMSLPKCHSRLKYWNLSEDSYKKAVLPYLVSEVA